MKINGSCAMIDGCTSIGVPNIHGKSCRFTDKDNASIFIDFTTLIRLMSVIEFECDMRSIDFKEWCDKKINEKE